MPTHTMAEIRINHKAYRSLIVAYFMTFYRLSWLENTDYKRQQAFIVYFLTSRKLSYIWSYIQYIILVPISFYFQHMAAGHCPFIQLPFYCKRYKLYFYFTSEIIGCSKKALYKEYFNVAFFLFNCMNKI